MGAAPGSDGTKRNTCVGLVPYSTHAGVSTEPPPPAAGKNTASERPVSPYSGSLKATGKLALRTGAHTPVAALSAYWPTVPAATAVAVMDTHRDVPFSNAIAHADGTPCRNVQLDVGAVGRPPPVGPMRSTPGAGSSAPVAPYSAPS